MSISKRLKFIADLVPECDTAADIGTDHAKLPVYLLGEGRVKRVIASDKSAGCVKKAAEAARSHSLEGKLESRYSDGLCGFYPGEAQCIVIAGMGGILMTEILSKGIKVTEQTQTLVLSPHRDADLVRSFLSDHSFRIVLDAQIEDKKKKYVVIKALNERFFLKEDARKVNI